MSKSLQKIVLLINLFHNRNFVTTHDAKTICGINERSFYRYINALSEIDIPIVYDRELKGYRLTEKVFKRRVDFSPYEITLLTLSLLLFSKQTINSYEFDIQSLYKKIISLANFPLESVLDSTELTCSNFDEKKAMSYFINYTILEIASSNGFSIDIDYSNHRGKTKMTISRPHIIFHEDWFVEDISERVKIPIKKIEHIAIKN